MNVSVCNICFCKEKGKKGVLEGGKEFNIKSGNGINVGTTGGERV